VKSSLRARGGKGGCVGQCCGGRGSSTRVVDSGVVEAGLVGGVPATESGKV
jgi:hypothetical protein